MTTATLLLSKIASFSSQNMTKPMLFSNVVATDFFFVGDIVGGRIGGDRYGRNRDDVLDVTKTITTMSRYDSCGREDVSCGRDSG